MGQWGPTGGPMGSQGWGPMGSQGGTHGIPERVPWDPIEGTWALGDPGTWTL